MPGFHLPNAVSVQGRDESLSKGRRKRLGEIPPLQSSGVKTRSASVSLTLHNLFQVRVSLTFSYFKPTVQPCVKRVW